MPGTTVTFGPGPAEPALAGALLAGAGAGRSSDPPGAGRGLGGVPPFAAGAVADGAGLPLAAPTLERAEPAAAAGAGVGAALAAGLLAVLGGALTVGLAALLGAALAEGAAATGGLALAEAAAATGGLALAAGALAGELGTCGSGGVPDALRAGAEGSPAFVVAGARSGVCSGRRLALAACGLGAATGWPRGAAAAAGRSEAGDAAGRSDAADRSEAGDAADRSDAAGSRLAARSRLAGCLDGPGLAGAGLADSVRPFRSPGRARSRSAWRWRSLADSVRWPRSRRGSSVRCWPPSRRGSSMRSLRSRRASRASS